VGPFEVGDWEDRVGRSFCFINCMLWLWRPAAVRLTAQYVFNASRAVY